MTTHRSPDRTVHTSTLACSLLDEALTLLSACFIPATHVQPAQAERPRQRGHPVVWDAQTILNAVQAFLNRAERLPTRKEWRKAQRHQLPARATVVKVYGSMDAVYAAQRLASHSVQAQRHTYKGSA